MLLDLSLLWFYIPRSKCKCCCVYVYVCGTALLSVWCLWLRMGLLNVLISSYLSIRVVAVLGDYCTQPILYWSLAFCYKLYIIISATRLRLPVVCA